MYSGLILGDPVLTLDFKSLIVSQEILVIQFLKRSTVTRFATFRRFLWDEVSRTAKQKNKTSFPMETSDNGGDGSHGGRF